MAKLNTNWFHCFGGAFETEEEVIEFIFERIDTKDFKDSYVDCAGYGEPNEMIKVTADDKKEYLYDFMMSLIDNNR